MLMMLRKAFKKNLRRKLEYNSFSVGRYSQVKNAINLWSFQEEKDIEEEEEKTISFVMSLSAEIGAGTIYKKVT